MNTPTGAQFGIGHAHVFLGEGHDKNERKTWAVIVLCTLMMIIEIAGGSIFGSLALVADGLHMSTHASAMLIAALAYTFARKHASDRRFVFGTGKLGDLAGFTSAIILAMIALLIGYEAINRFLAPVPIRFNEAIPIAVLGLVVNLVSAWLLSGDDHGHGHAHSHGHGDAHGEHSAGHHDHADESQRIETDETHSVEFAEHEPHDDHRIDSRDHNIRAAYIHVIADAAVSFLAIIGLLLAKVFGWLWMDPVAGIVGAFVIANWSYGLIRVTGAILVDISPDEGVSTKIKSVVTAAGDQLVDLHVWRLGPGHLGAVMSIVSSIPGHGAAYYHARLQRFKGLSHVTVEVHQRSIA